MHDKMTSIASGRMLIRKVFEVHWIGRKPITNSTSHWINLVTFKESFDEKVISHMFQEGDLVMVIYDSYHNQNIFKKLISK